MKKMLGCSLLLLVAFAAGAQSLMQLSPGELRAETLSSADTFRYVLQLKAGEIYQFVLKQQGIGVYYTLKDDKGRTLVVSDTPEELDATEKFEQEALTTGTYRLTISRFPHPENTEKGQFQLAVKALDQRAMARRRAIKKELLAENKKMVQTLDIDHFWEAFDRLSTARSFTDSCTVLQDVYLDRATDGLRDFIRVRDLTPEKYVLMISQYPKFLRSIRQRTFLAKQWQPEAGRIFERFQKVYPAFKPFKVCFAIGILNTGGTVSNDFVLVGTEMMAATNAADLSEFPAGAFRDNLAFNGDVSKKVSSLIAHECVHTQQQPVPDRSGTCPLLAQCLKEGIADLVGELVSGNAYTGNHRYGDAHEAALWQEFRQHLCDKETGRWLYNATTVKDRPADLGYYMGYKIARYYLQRAADKTKALSELINMDDPQALLKASGYSPAAQ